MRLRIEMVADFEDEPAAVVARARQAHARSAPVVSVDGMTEEEALAMGDLTEAELRTHPRRVTPEQAIPDAASAVLWLAEDALSRAGVCPEESSCTPLRDRPRRLRGGEAAPGRRPRPARGPQRARRTPGGRRAQ